MIKAKTHVGIFKAETHVGMYKAVTHLSMYKAEIARGDISRATKPLSIVRLYFGCVCSGDLAS